VSLANHQIIDFYGCDKDILSNSDIVKSYFVKAAEMSHATIVSEKFHEFSPFGLTGVLVITESHISIHTWPEYGYVAIDVFSCCDKLDHKRLVDVLQTHFKAKKVNSKSIKRGRHGRAFIRKG
jgi:S-adenosylmethionine decarboxylase proenzyme|tara:strand:+ start:2820 stop:3188 length:369 start_codon:yes stop_codon:yes gene_type:complete